MTFVLPYEETQCIPLNTLCEFMTYSICVHLNDVDIIMLT